MSNFNFQHIFRDLNDHLGLELYQFLDIIEMTRREYFHIQNKGPSGKSNTLSRISKLSDYLGVSLEKLIEGEIDFKVLRKRFITPSLAISDKYIISGGSYMDTIRHMLNYCKHRYGERLFRLVLSQLQMEENVIYNDKLMVNMHFLNDLFTNLEKIGMTENDIIELAAFVNLKGKRASVFDLLKDTRSDLDFLEVMVKNQKAYELNFEYSLHVLGSSYCLIAKRNEHSLGFRNEICVESLSCFKAATIGKAPVLRGRSSLNFINVNSGFENGRFVQKYIFNERNAFCYH